MLNRHLRHLPPLASALTASSAAAAAKAKKKKSQPPKKKSRNLVKLEQLRAEAASTAEPVSGSEFGDAGVSPISRLIQIQQAKREKEPVYTLVAEKGMPRNREFVMQVGERFL